MRKKLSIKSRSILILLPLVISIVLVEWLCSFFPYSLAQTGHWASDSALKYGWGFRPNEKVIMQDMDTGEKHVYNINNNGWRDIDRIYKNLDNRFRILIIGDSVTFGCVIDEDLLYTRILEKTFIENHQPVEVISIGYGGWGTDQALEALINEGFKYNPNLVIFQFCGNDLWNNAYYERNEFENTKPFKYSIENGNLVKKINNKFMQARNFRDSIKKVIQKFEISKRIYGIYLSYRMKEPPITRHDFSNKHDLVYENSFRSRENLNLEFKDKRIKDLVSILEKDSRSELEMNKIESLITKTDNLKRRDSILRIMEKRWIKQFWNKDKYYKIDSSASNKYHWDLYFKIINKANKLCIKNDTNFGVFCQDDKEFFKFWREWFLASEKSASQNATELYNYNKIKNFCLKNSILFIPTNRNYTRPRNDAHPDENGHKAMALDIYDFINSNFKIQSSLKLNEG
tara:strand:+ start:12136 stop:13509 length:1374 start_codon:yes stop_codon:yes gene_type:complete